MSQKGPGRSDRIGLTVMELFEMFPDDLAAEKWFENRRWPKVRSCPDCGTRNGTVRNRKPMPYRCWDCRSYFSVRKGTVMEGSKLGMRKWIVALYMMTTRLKGTSSLKVHRELGITQKTAWHLMQRIREAYCGNIRVASHGPVEADETYLGGKRRNMPYAKRKLMKGRGTAGKTIVAGIKDRGTREVFTEIVPDASAETLQDFVLRKTEEGNVIYTDDARAYKGIPGRPHESVNHSAGEYVRGDAHTNGIESFWSMFKRGCHGTYHHLSPKHAHRYLQEFQGRQNLRDHDTIWQMRILAWWMFDRRLRYKDLIADPKGLSNRSSDAQSALATGN